MMSAEQASTYLPSLFTLRQVELRGLCLRFSSQIFPLHIFHTIIVRGWGVIPIEGGAANSKRRWRVEAATGIVIPTGLLT
jgi:hypothetical protein